MKHAASKGWLDPPQRGLKLIRQTLDLAAIERDRARLHPAARPGGPNLQLEWAARAGPGSAQRRPIDRELDLAAEPGAEACQIAEARRERPRVALLKRDPLL